MYELENQTLRFHNKRKGLVNCVYKSCVTGKPLTKLINTLSAYCIMNVF